MTTSVRVVVGFAAIATLGGVVNAPAAAIAITIVWLLTATVTATRGDDRVPERPRFTLRDCQKPHKDERVLASAT